MSSEIYAERGINCIAVETEKNGSITYITLLSSWILPIYICITSSWCCGPHRMTFLWVHRWYLTQVIMHRSDCIITLGNMGKNFFFETMETLEKTSALFKGWSWISLLKGILFYLGLSWPVISRWASNRAWKFHLMKGLCGTKICMQCGI